MGAPLAGPLCKKGAHDIDHVNNITQVSSLNVLRFAFSSASFK